VTPLLSPQFLLIFSAILHAGWNTTTKAAKDKDMFVLLTIVLSSIMVLGALFVQDHAYVIGGAEGFKFSFFAGLFEGGYLVALARSFARTSLARGYSIMRGGAMVFVWAVSLPLGLEAFHWLSLTGSIVVLIGILVTGIQKDKPFSLLDRDMMWPLAGAVFIAGYHLCYGESLKYGALPNSLYLTSLTFSLPFIFISSRKGLFTRMRITLFENKFLLLLSSSACALGFTIFLHGLSHSGPGYAITLRNTSIFFSIGFSFFIHDRMTKAQIIGASIVGLGAIILGLGSI
jgi:drug/metabolite transporter (DMT)-like permease